MASVTPVEQHLTYALAGSVIGQVAAHRGYELKALCAEDSPIRDRLTEELTEFGVYPDQLAQHALLALLALFAEETNADSITSCFTALLWDVLGDPDSGVPPEIYRRAGVVMHAAVLQLITPFPEKQ